MTSHTSTTNGSSGHILRSLMLFAEVLRGLGLDVSSGNVLDLVRTTEFTPLGRKHRSSERNHCLGRARPGTCWEQLVPATVEVKRCH